MFSLLALLLLSLLFSEMSSSAAAELAAANEGLDVEKCVRIS